ncbi:MAG: sigma-70 family RNA polymerase sigma factor [Sandaracinaceae bacterium]|nr:sigma-70 family RNA polymerase sigma factor [Sandaracinaceae bacterium]
MDALSRYRVELARLRPLDRESEAELGRAARCGDVDARRALVESALPLVTHVARRYLRWGLPLEDLIQQGNIGVLEAVARFDPERGCRLARYAQYWVRAQIREFVVHQHRAVRLGTTRGERRAIRLYRRGEARSPEELAALSGISHDAAARLVPLLNARDVRLDVAWGAPKPSSSGSPARRRAPSARSRERTSASRCAACSEVRCRSSATASRAS